MDGKGNMKDQVCVSGRVLKDSPGKGVISVSGRNLVQENLPGIYKDGFPAITDNIAQTDIYCNQTRLPAEELGHQPSHITFNPIVCSAYGMC